MLKERLAKISARALKQYQVVVYDKESLSESRNFTTKPLGLTLIVAGLALLLIAGTTALIFMVPGINRNIPGFKDPVELQAKYDVLQEQNLALEREVEKLDTMLAAFTRIAGMNNPTDADREMWAAVTPEAENNVDPSASQDEQPTTPFEGVNMEVPRETPSQMRSKPKPPTEFINLVPPLDGIITNEFNLEEKPHYGMDIVADENSLIRSVADGVVIFSEYSNTTGHVIGVWHGKENLVSFYKHNSKVFRQVGEYVFAGEAIAVIGNTGINSSGTHLHFEMWYDNNPVNPADYIIFN